MDIFKEYNLALPEEKKIELPARISKRIFGFIIDFFLLQFAVLFPLQKLLPETTSLTQAMIQIGSLPDALLTVFAATIGLVLLLYFSLFECYLGYTPGMRLVGIQTTRMTFSQAVLRNIFVIPVFPFPIMWVIELYFLFRTKQRFMENFTKTGTFEAIYY